MLIFGVIKFNVYPNIVEPTEWWRLGNLKTDGVDTIIKAYRDETTPGMMMNRQTHFYGVRRYSAYGQKSVVYRIDYAKSRYL